ncbi:MAG: nuclear transport factor 2 family protein [Halolamina sp.]
MTTDHPDRAGSFTDGEPIEEIMAAWQTFDDTGDLSVLTDHLADDVVHSPMGGKPVVGKGAVVEHLRGLDPTENDWEMELDDVEVGTDLAIARATIRGQTAPDDGSDPEEIVLSSVDVFRREDDGSWKQIISHPNGNG